MWSDEPLLPIHVISQTLRYFEIPEHARPVGNRVRLKITVEEGATLRQKGGPHCGRQISSGKLEPSLAGPPVEVAYINWSNFLCGT